MLIRPYAAADRKACLALFESNTPPYFAPEELPAFVRWLDAQDGGQLLYAENQAKPYFVAEINGKVRACGGLCVHRHTTQLILAWGMVAADLHRRGIGRALLLHRLQFAAHHYPDHTALLDTSQHSFPFFEKLGFEVIKITPNGYAPGLHRYDMQRTAQPIKKPEA